MISLKAIASATLLILASLQVAAQAQTLEMPSDKLPVTEAEPTFNAADLSTEPIELAQRRRRARRGAGGVAANFVGGGINIGLGDDDSIVGDTNFAVISKISLINRLAVRPAALIGDDVDFLLPVTYTPRIPTPRFAPYVGAGVGIGDDVEALVVAGADVPISRQFTANGQAHVGFGDDTGVGIMLGVGYNFSAF
ncbi:MAG: hypothetical protein AAFW84_26280 [Cyanobacteria bacterium J06635_15]